jgi:hypothetical protein
MPINTGTFPARLREGIRSILGMEDPRYPRMLDNIFNSISSDRNFEDFIGFAGTGLMEQKAEGAPILEDDISQGIASRIVPLEYGKILSMTSIMVEDDKYMPKLISKLADNFRNSMKETEDVIAHGVLNSGFSTVTSLMYKNPDGKALFATDHVRVKGGTFSNTLSTTVPLSEYGLETLITQMRRWKDNAGITLNVMPMKLVVPPELEHVASRILKSEKRSGTADNDINTLKSLYDIQIVVSPYLSDAENWFLTTSKNVGENGLLFVTRKEAELDADKDFRTKNYLTSITKRIGVGYNEAYAICGVQGA